jgi:hypothetical protein
MTFAPPNFCSSAAGSCARLSMYRQAPREFASGFFIRPARDRHRLEAHLRCKLDPQMAESAQAEHRHQIAGPRAAVAETVERGDAGAHQRRRLHRGQFLRHPRQRFGARDRVIGIAAVAGDAGDVGGRLAGKEVPPAAVIAIPAVSAVPAEAGALAGRPSGHARADCIDNPDDLMSWNSRVRYTRKVSFLSQRIAVADSASLHLDSYRSCARIRDLPFHDLKGSAGAGHLHRAHLRHMASNNDLDTLSGERALGYSQCFQLLAPLAQPHPRNAIIAAYA